MQPLTKISQAPETNPALEQSQLFALGMDHVRRLSRELWTDHNLHDPGITTLELACFALTELGYRAQFPLEDLLATRINNQQAMNKQFFAPAEVLPNRPLTTADYRKLLIDIDGVENAWLLPQPLVLFANVHTGELQTDGETDKQHLRRVEVRGLYDVLIEYETGISEKAQGPINDKIRSKLHQNRNLCEDFDQISHVEDEMYSLCAEIELTADADPNRVAATLFFELSRYLNPRVKQHSLSEMLARQHVDSARYTLPEIFEGPLLENGFIDDAELAASELRTEIRLSDMINIAMDIKGVLAVRDMIVNRLTLDAQGNVKEPVPAVADDKWRLIVPPGKRPVLANLYAFDLINSKDDAPVPAPVAGAPVPASPRPDVTKCPGRIVFYKRQIPLTPNKSRIQSEYRQLVNDDATATPRQTQESAIPTGQFRDLSSYFSFQNHFPTIYGLSEAGLPSTATEARKAQVLQLKGYLLFFDQLMANFFAQTARVADLFSRDNAESSTYFGQKVDSFRDWEKLYPNPLSPNLITNVIEAVRSDKDYQSLFSGSHDLAEIRTRLDEAAYLAAQDRRSRIVDHMLARCAEDFRDYVNIMSSVFGASLQRTITTRYEFLRDFPELAAQRGGAYNRTVRDPEAPWVSDNISGFERRLFRLLGISNASRRKLSEISYGTKTELEQTADGQLFVRIRHPVSGETLLLSPDPLPPGDNGITEVRRVIEVGLDLNSYRQTQSADGQEYFFAVVDAQQKTLSPSNPKSFASAAARADAIDAQVAHLRSYYSGEGMYLVESILLRPPTIGSKALVPICVDPRCLDCSDYDPYSYRVHIVLPIYAGRFQNEGFRDFVEETIRQELPAHILPRICWIQAGRMATFEATYEAWLNLLRPPPEDGPGSSPEEMLQNLIHQLFEVHNVYEKSRIPDCNELEDQSPPFILGKSHLGEPESPQK
jgi:hypothetical protein